MNALGAMIAMLCLATIAALASAEELEPRVQTSSAAAPTASGPSEPATTAGSLPAAAGAPGTGASGADGTDRKAARTPARNVPAASVPAVNATAKNTPATSTGKTSKGDKASERVELGTTQISGNRELPRVMYVVPWRKPELGEFAGRPPNSLLDEALTPVDRDVFRRQNRYYTALQQQATPGQSPPGAGERTAPPSTKAEQ